MDNQLFLEKLSPRQWWWLKIKEFFQGLLVSGLITFFIYCALGASVVNVVRDYQLVLWAVITFVILYFIYMILASVLYAFGCLIDAALNDKESESFRLQLFNSIYWLAVAVPVLAIGFLVYIVTKTPNSLV
jgi:hypothetical protein